jgi:hypothetical protein
MEVTYHPLIVAPAPQNRARLLKGKFNQLHASPRREAFEPAKTSLASGPSWDTLNSPGPRKARESLQARYTALRFYLNLVTSL